MEHFFAQFPRGSVQMLKSTFSIGIITVVVLFVLNLIFLSFYWDVVYNDYETKYFWSLDVFFSAFYALWNLIYAFFAYGPGGCVGILQNPSVSVPYLGLSALPEIALSGQNVTVSLGVKHIFSYVIPVSHLYNTYDLALLERLSSLSPHKPTDDLSYFVSFFTSTPSFSFINELSFLESSGVVLSPEVNDTSTNTTSTESEVKPTKRTVLSLTTEDKKKVLLHALIEHRHAEHRSLYPSDASSRFVDVSDLYHRVEQLTAVGNISHTPLCVVDILLVFFVLSRFVLSIFQIPLRAYLYYILEYLDDNILEDTILASQLVSLSFHWVFKLHMGIGALFQNISILSFAIVIIGLFVQTPTYTYMFGGAVLSLMLYFYTITNFMLRLGNLNSDLDTTSLFGYQGGASKTQMEQFMLTCTFKDLLDRKVFVHTPYLPTSRDLALYMRAVVNMSHLEEEIVLANPSNSSSQDVSESDDVSDSLESSETDTLLTAETDAELHTHLLTGETDDSEVDRVVTQRRTLSSTVPSRTAAPSSSHVRPASPRVYRKLLVSAHADDQCSICFETFVPTDVVWVLGCRHFFHRAHCGEMWFKKKAQCSLCRKAIHVYRKPFVDPSIPDPIDSSLSVDPSTADSVDPSTSDPVDPSLPIDSSLPVDPSTSDHVEPVDTRT